MAVRPRISLCIPTLNRAECLRIAAESALREAESLPPGTVEVLVSDNASTDHTGAVIAQIQEGHPQLRALRNEKNIGFDLNYLQIVSEARGEFVWVLGDDDLWAPGSVARVLQELDAGADACLCLAQACDMDMNPQRVLPWFLDAEPPRVWHLRTREDLITYFNGCARNAAAFAFISVGIFRRDRFLENREAMLESHRQNLAYIHVWGMMTFFRQPLALHYIPEPLVLNRMVPTHAENQDLYQRWMLDLRGWAALADGAFGDDPELAKAFNAIVGRNHHDTILPGLRLHSATEEQWQEAKPYLERAGFTPVQIAAVELGFQTLYQNRPPSPHLNAATLCLADLGMVARAARRIAVLALGSLEDLFHGSPLLASLRVTGRTVRVLATAEACGYLDGFDIQRVDPARYLRDVPYREAEARKLVDFGPELIVNLDRNRELWGDDLVSAVQPQGALAFRLPDRGQEARLVQMVNDNYHCLLPGDAAPQRLLEALELDPVRPLLWPPPGAVREAELLLDKVGWDPERIVAVIADNLAVCEDPAFRAALAEAGQSGWKLLGLGGQGTHARLRELLAPWKEQSFVLAGLNAQSTAAVLMGCPHFIGGTTLLRAMAEACGCTPA